MLRGCYSENATGAPYKLPAMPLTLTVLYGILFHSGLGSHPGASGSIFQGGRPALLPPWFAAVIPVLATGRIIRTVPFFRTAHNDGKHLAKWTWNTFVIR